jgi:type II secretory ATPase GspE/PulE/Tfp pilus assembly ATPase PilB-like protein
VLSTLHTNDAPSSVTRLLDLGIQHFLITSTIIGILAQRLVRENCSHCLEEYTPTQDEAALLRMDPARLKDYKFKRGRGCLHCRQTGYSGRVGIYEVMPLTDKVRALITRGASSADLFKAAREEGMRTLREAAIEKVFRGITTTTEMARVTGK